MTMTPIRHLLALTLLAMTLSSSAAAAQTSAAPAAAPPPPKPAAVLIENVRIFDGRA